ncbi:MAG: hypothetical protein ACRDRM_09855, partial [Pseudonocardiaceae bacterium]
MTKMKPNCFRQTGATGRIEMPSNKLLGTYLNDHLAGATAGAELAEKLSSEYASTTHGSFLSELARDI